MRIKYRSLVGKLYVHLWNQKLTTLFLVEKGQFLINTTFIYYLQIQKYASEKKMSSPNQVLVTESGESYSFQMYM